MNSSWIASILLPCLLICIVQSASINRERRGVISSDFLRELADRIDFYNEWLQLNEFDNNNKQVQEKRGDCDSFGGCAQLTASQQLAYRTRHRDLSNLFGTGGPGRKRRSTQPSDAQN
ncbi:uncharacterized protein LOC117100408 [Anneissia japonica]|uniref:uncharacterized protein LOC117100408 n=1 Tax=Anneissia japonica TaxID=1529436 RepID=UPI00142579F4|nr:uncharacterized protein LOC117100408 [Anneissia japonica]